MPALDGLKFRTGLGENDPFAGDPGRSLETARFRAYANSTNDPEPLPEPGAENFGGSGIVVDDDYKTRIVGYWQFWRKSYESGFYTVWPDLAWRWQKHPYGVVTGSLGEKPPIYGGTYEAGETHLTEEGPFWKGEYAPGYASSPAPYIQPLPAVTSSYVYTTHLKFTWAGMMQGGLFNGLTGDGWYANSGSGVWVAGVSAGVQTPDAQHDGNFFVTFKYGHYDPGPGDSFSLTKAFTYPIKSVLNPELAYESLGQEGNEGSAGKYTFVMVCDNYTTKVGMIKGHNGGEIEWFGEMTPFTYDSGFRPGPSTGIAVSRYAFHQTFGNVDYGGFLGSSFAHWHGWINEYAISSTPYDTLLGELGHLEPDFGYTHLDHVRVRANA